MTVQQLIDALSAIHNKDMQVCFNEVNENVVLFVHEVEPEAKLTNDQVVTLLSGY